MATRQATPKMFSRGARDKGQESYLKQLEDLMKLNKGGFNTFAEDTGAESGFIVPGGVPVRQGMVAPTVQSFQAPQSPEYSQIPDFQGYDGQLPQEQGTTSIQDFFGQATQDIFQPSQSQDTEYLEALYQATGTPYAVQSLEDGTVRMNDGSIKDPSVEVFPIRSNQDGTVGMSDGSSRSIDPQLAQYLIGTQALSQAFLGQQQPVTQAFGNYNPSLEPGAGYNLGTDFRTRNLQQRQVAIPFDATVVQVLQDDGTRWGDRSGHQGYGNSILIEVPTGERFRLSHLASLPNVQVGQQIGAGTVFIEPGATGNVDGEHLDLEYYNEQGQIADPSTFDATRLLPYTGATQSVDQQPQPQQNQPTPQPDQPQSTGLLAQARQARDGGQGIIGSLANTGASAIGKAVETPGNILEQAGTSVGAKDYLVGELGRGEATPKDVLQRTGQNISANIEQANLTPRIDTGLSELLRGDIAGAKQNLASTLSRVGSRASRLPGQVASQIVKPVSADDGQERTPVESLGQNIRGAAESASNYLQDKTQDIAQAGQGISKLFGNIGQGAGSLVNLFSRKDPSAISGQRAVGDQSAGGDVLGARNVQSLSGLKDTTDPFFKSDLFQGLKQFTTFEDGEPGRDQALSLDLFKPEFFQDQQNISSVFGGTNLEGDAQAKFNQYQAEQEAKRKAEENKPSLQDYLNMGKTAAQWYAETGQQSTLDEIGRDTRSNIDLKSGAISRVGESPKPSGSSIQQTRQSGRSAVELLKANPITTSPTPYREVSDSSGSTQVVREGEVPISQRSAQVRPGTDTSKGIFNRLKEGAKGIFNRFFN